LRDAVVRLLRAPPDRQAGRLALALHLSRLDPPAPRPYHRRVARAVLDDAARRYDGQVFALRNGDLVMLLQAADAGTALATTLARLFQVDVPNADLLLSRWLLPGDADGLLAFVDARLADDLPGLAPDHAALVEPSAGIGAFAAIDALIENSPVSDLMQRQTAVLLSPGGSARLRPLFREITFSLAVLEARVASAGHLVADPFLLRHLATRLDGHMLQALADDLRGGGPLTAGARDRGPMLTLNLTLPGILSAGFASFAAACHAAGARVGIEVSLLDACADAEAFLLARERLGVAGLTMVLDGVSHHALMLTTPAALQPDLVKLDWSKQLPEAGSALETALADLGPARVVLHRAETEEALRWGLAQGIRRFQGRHVDAMLAAGRIGACPQAALCTPRQCMERASATASAGRVGCRNTVLLDAAAPLEALPA